LESTAFRSQLASGHLIVRSARQSNRSLSSDGRQYVEPCSDRQGRWAVKKQQPSHMIHTHLLKTKTKKEQAYTTAVRHKHACPPGPVNLGAVPFRYRGVSGSCSHFHLGGMAHLHPAKSLGWHTFDSQAIESGTSLEQMLPCAISNGSGLACLSAEPNSKPPQSWRFFSLKIGLVRFFHPSAIFRTWLAQLHAHVFRPTVYVAGVAGRITHCSL
jgi:hypothetical protein